MKVKFIAFIACMAGMLSACHHDDDPTPPTPEPVPAMADRTVLVYIAGDNSLTSGTDFASLDLAEMVTGIEGVDTKKNNLIVYMDRKYNDPQLIRLCRNTNNEIIQDTIQSYAVRNSVGVSEMTEVLSKVYSEFPASSYGLSLWSHGEGWLPPSSASMLKATTRWFGQDGIYYMSIFDLHDVLKTAPHLDFVMFDACFMQSIEVAYELRDCADYFIGSPTEIPGPGAPYDKVVPAFFGKGTADEIAKNIALQYYEPYAAIYDDTRSTRNDNWTGGVSVGVLKSSKLENLAIATKQAVNAHIESDATTDVTSVLYYGRGGRSYYYTDMDGFVKLISKGDATYTQWKQAFDEAMIFFKTTPKNYSGSEYSAAYGLFSMEGACGLSAYIPCRSTTEYRTSYNNYYKGYQWYTGVNWASKGW